MSDIKVNLLFPTPLIEIRFDGADQLIEPLRQAIMNRKATSPGCTNPIFTAGIPMLKCCAGAGRRP